MANPLYNRFFGHQQPVQPGTGANMQMPSNAQATASNPSQMTMMDAVNQLRSNPIGMIRQSGYNVPDEIVNNPQATVMHLIQTGQVKSPMMQRIQPMLNMLMGKR